mgnify:CR=1 FL=1
MGEVIEIGSRRKPLLNDPWSARDKALLVAFHARLVQRGLDVVLANGLTEDGRPWASIVRHDGDVFVHVTHDDTSWLMFGAALSTVRRDTLENLLEARLEYREAQ